MKARYSLTTRLTVFFTLASALVLIGLGTLVAISIDRHFVELDRDALRDKVHLTREVIGKSKSPQDLKTRLDDVLHSHEVSSSPCFAMVNRCTRRRTLSFLRT